ncbi:MAG TPA: S-layer homology domain-containing protein [Bacillota bacterium]|nr:S-layer homology domain-containing protein [Bacillota bacterium]HNT03194.1 S-layer homology domain-containing protein [Bacillota bacterium]HPA53526.1 S-layer homology domain-containing protein [Bacillota bacterium]HPX67845.1 S-layer homology domain-containing protein [Bacillota bacterium]HQO42521.1 S-layer homology domain-containing protein [Bacillota bacterium]
MKVKIKLLLLALVYMTTTLIPLTVHAQVHQSPQIQWQKAFGGSDNTEISEVIQTSDGGYLAIGTTNSPDGDITTKQRVNEPGSGFREDDDLLVVKFDSNGQPVWHQTLGGSAGDMGFAVRQHSDGTFILAGMTFSKNGDVVSNQNNPSSDFVVWMVKLSAKGDILWEKVLQDVDTEASKVISLHIIDDGYLMGIQGGKNNFYNAYAVRLDFQGSIRWQKTLPGYYLYDIAQLNNGDFISAGDFIVRFTQDGDILWQEPSVKEEQSIEGTADGGFVWAVSVNQYHRELIDLYKSVTKRSFPMALYSDTYNTSPIIMVVKFDSGKNPQWANYLGGSRNEHVISIKQTSDGYYAILARSESRDGDISDSKGNSDFWLTGLSSEGILIWEKSLGGSNADEPKSLVAEKDGYIVAGYTNSNDKDVKGLHNPTKSYSYDAWIAKLGWNEKLDTYAGNYPSSWAQTDVEEAKTLGLTSNNLLGSYTENITREDFSELVVRLYEILTKHEAPLPEANPFNDTVNLYVLKACELGIVTGAGNNMFMPKDSLTREQASLMFFRLMNKIKPGLDTHVSSPKMFEDHTNISNWAVDAVYYINYRGIIQGSNNQMTPKGALTREQAIILAKRMYENIDKYQLDEFRLVQQSPIIVSAGQTININVIVRGSDFSNSEKITTWKVDDNSIASISGDIVGGYTNWILGEVAEKTVIISGYSASVTGNKEGTTRLTVFIGERSQVQSRTYEIIVKR